MPAERIIDGDDIFRLIYALDAIIPAMPGDWSRLTLEERERWGPFGVLRDKLSDVIGLGMYDEARSWRQRELGKERESTVEAIHSGLSALLKEPNLTRRQFREGMVKVMQGVKAEQQYKRPEMSNWPSSPANLSRRT